MIVLYSNGECNRSFRPHRHRLVLVAPAHRGGRGGEVDQAPPGIGGGAEHGQERLHGGEEAAWAIEATELLVRVR